MSGIYPDSIDELSTNALSSGSQLLPKLGGHDARGDGYARQVRHLLSPDNQFLGCICAGGCPQDQMESVFGIDGQTRDLCAEFITGNVSSFAAIAIEGEGAQLGSREIYRIPFEDNRRLRGIATAQDGCRRRVLTKCVVDLRL